MSRVKLEIDYREKKLIALLKDKELPYHVMTLDIGDIIFYLDNKPVFIIERKTVKDLAASIRDGRHRNQKLRITKQYPNHQERQRKVMYLIEGKLADAGERDRVPKETLVGAITNTIIRDYIQVLRTLNLEETVLFLGKMYHKIAEHADKIEKSNEELYIACISTSKSEDEAEYSSTIKKEKKANLTPEVCYLTQLSQIPGVSTAIAQTIANEYPSMKYLILTYQRVEEGGKKKEKETKRGKMSDEEGLLANLTYQIANDKVRRIGPSVSKRVYEYLYCGNGN